MIPEPLLKFHDKAYVVTYAAAEERQRGVIEQLGEGNFEFVYGVDKRDVTKECLIADGTYDEDLAIRVDPKGRAMTLGARRLEHRLAIPIQAQPFQPGENRLHRRVGIARRVGILDAKDKRPPRMTGIKPIKQSCAGTADMEVASGRWSETYANHGMEKLLSTDKPKCADL